MPVAIAIELIHGVAIRALHLPLAGVALVLGAAAASLRRTRWAALRVVAVPAGAMATTVLAARATGRGSALPLAVAGAAAAGAVIAAVVAGARSAPAIVARSNWLLGATIAWFGFLSTPDTEWAVAALGWLAPLAIVEVVMPRRCPAAQVGAEIAATAAVVLGALVLGGSDAIAWTNWWGAKLAGAAVAAVLVLSPSGRGRRRPGPGPVRRG